MGLFQNIFKRGAAPPLRLCQLHEHLQLMDTGVESFEPDDTLRDACIEAAQTVWLQTGLSSWDAHPREAQYAYKCGDKLHGYLHINADHKDCFLIVIFELKAARPVGYLLFDIGAEYASPIYVCPAAAFEDEPTPAVIEESIPRLNSHKDAYAVLDRGHGTYMQAYQESSGGYTLEHQLVTPSSHYRVAGGLDAQQVIAAFKWYAFEKKEWARELKWEKMEL
ncbi:MAG: hypothetical protein JWN73_516 [Betaproteobacteria bacterium]|nr:hypothetical protein [Betaproteobacteria bacterium]